MMAFDHPAALYAAPLVALAFGGLALLARHVRVHRAWRWSNELGERASRYGRWGSLLLVLATMAAVVALAGPRWGSREVETETKGLSLVLAVDISRSMLAEDDEPSRLERAKRQARRLIHDLGGDRIGLIAFSAQSYIMSPLTVDGSALHLLLDVLDPEIASGGGTELARAIRQGHDLLLGSDEVADRVLTIFTDGETHDSLPAVLQAAERLQRAGMHLILVAEGGREPVRIPVRDVDGRFVGFQRDTDDRVVQTRRRDDIMSDIADAAEGVLVSAEVEDQAGRVRDLIAEFKRTPKATTTAAQDVSRAWVPAIIAVVALLLHTFTRRTMALAAVLLAVGFATPLSAQRPRNSADDAWLEGEFERAKMLYARQAEMGKGGDTTFLNAGTAALASNDTAGARQFLERAARSLEPEVRFRARYNLGLLALILAERDSAALEQHLTDARDNYREALLLKPDHADAKWNLELAIRLTPPSQSQGGGGGQGGGDGDSDPPPPQGLSTAQAEQILNSIAEEERRTRLRLQRRRAQVREARGRRDW